MKHSRSMIFAATAALFALLFGHTEAQNSSEVIEGTVVQVFFITQQSFNLRSLEEFQLAGSIEEADSSSTVVAIECVGDDVDATVCGTEPQTITFAPSTWIAADSTGNMGMSIGCSIASNTQSAVCEGTLEGPEDMFTNPGIRASDLSSLLIASGEDLTSITFSTTFESTDISYLPVTITAGQERLQEASESASASASESTDSSGSAGESEGSGSATTDGSDNGNGAGRTVVTASGLVALVLGVTIMIL